MTTTATTVELSGKRFVILEEKQYRKLLDQVQEIENTTQQDWGDLAESKRRLAEPGANIPWERMKAERASKKNSGSNGKRGR